MTALTSGSKYALDHMEKMFTWDSGSRLGNVDIRGQVLEVHEFDYTAVNNEIYNENGVSIRTIPAIHECFITPQDLVNKEKWTPGAALNVGAQVHTSPAQFGKVFRLWNYRFL